MNVSDPVDARGGDDENRGTRCGPVQVDLRRYAGDAAAVVGRGPGYAREMGPSNSEARIAIRRSCRSLA